jgi:hypothetical protein
MMMKLYLCRTNKNNRALGRLFEAKNNLNIIETVTERDNFLCSLEVEVAFTMVQ